MYTGFAVKWQTSCVEHLKLRKKEQWAGREIRSDEELTKRQIKKKDIDKDIFPPVKEID